MADGYADGRGVLLSAVARALRPPSSLPLSQWSEKYREVPAGPHAGPWRNAMTPYLVEPMDRLSISDPARSVTLRGSGQIGKTEVPVNWLLYLAEVDPAPVIIALQSGKKAEEFSDEKLSPSIRESRHARQFYIPEKVSSGKASSTLIKRLKAGRSQRVISILTSKNLQSSSIKYIIGDELGEWPADVDGRGDPIDQLEIRQISYEEVGAKSYYGSTPGVVGACLITRLYERGDQRLAYLKCPHCGDFSPLVFENMAGPDGETGPHFVAQCCGGIVEHRHKLRMLESLVFLPTFKSENEENPAPPFVVPNEQIERWRARDTERRQLSYHVWQAYSRLVSWQVIWTKWLDAKDQPLKLKAFSQQILAEPYEDARNVPDLELLMARRREWRRGRVPHGAYLLTAGVDVQADRLEWAVWGWGPGGSGFLVDFGIIPGDPALPGVWAELQKQVVLRTFEGPAGQRVPVKATAIDTGYQTQAVYRFASNNPNVFAIDGRDGVNTPPLGTASPTRDRLCLLYPVGTHGLKSLLYSLLKLTLAGPDESGMWAYGAQHFPMDCDQKFFEQLTAETLKEVADRFGRVSLKWDKPDHARNEQMDLWVYARAMAEGMPGGGLSSWSYPGPMWESIIAEFGAQDETGQLDLAAHWAPVGAPPEHASGGDEKPAKPGRIVLKRREG